MIFFLSITGHITWNYIGSFITPPKCGIPSLRTPVWKPLSFNTSHWFFICHRGLGGRVLLLLCTERWVAPYHWGKALHVPCCRTWQPMMGHSTCIVVSLDEPVTSQVYCDRFDCGESSATIILFIQSEGRPILLRFRRIVGFLSSQWQYILARSIRFLFSWTHGCPKTFQCIKSFTVESLMTPYKLCLYATP